MSSRPFTPFHQRGNGADSVSGYQSDARALDLFAEADRKQHAGQCLLQVLSCAEGLSNCNSEELAGCFMAVRHLTEEAGLLYEAAFDRASAERTAPGSSNQQGAGQ